MAHTKRRPVGQVRRDMALRLGAIPGGTVTVRCAYCPHEGVIWWPTKRNGEPGAWVAFGGLEVDHIHPEALGGATVADNLTLACRTCNRRKGSKGLAAWLGEK